MSDFPELITAIKSWVMNGRCTVRDLEFYETFNQEYRPSHWMPNPAADDELWTFAQDGAGGQYVLWVAPSGVDGAPVLKLGRDGELVVLGRDLLDFAWLIACGLEPIAVQDGGGFRGELTASAEMQQWLRSLAPERSFGSARETLDAAAAAYPELVAHVRALAAG
jgi:hypothetical protein